MAPKLNGACLFSFYVFFLILLMGTIISKNE
jgi:hypothetical protein